MTLPSETLMAYIDGELPAEEARRVEAEIAAQPDLQAYVEQQRTLARAMHDSFDDVLQAPLPDALAKAMSRSRWRAIVWAAIESVTTRRFALWSGIPAALTCGILIGVLIHGRADIVSADGALVASGALDHTLTQQLASQPTQTVQAKIGISFRDNSGRYCRTFQTASSLAGVACHAEGRWQIAAVAESAAEPSNGAPYQLAGSPMPAFVRNAVTAMISGAPLDAAGEREAKASGW